jgi:two-component system NtrC family sensor kinase
MDTSGNGRVLNSVQMTSEREPDERLRVALVGDAQEGSWASVLGSRPLDVLRVADLESLSGVRANVAVAAVRAEEAPAMAQVIASLQDAPPITLLVGPDPRHHPQLRLLEVLIQAKRDWEGTFDAIVDPVALLDRTGALVRANLGFARVVGRNVQDIIALPCSSLVGPPLEGQPDPIASSLEDGAPRTDETRYQALAGIQQVTTSPLRDAGNGIQGLVVILKDVADLKEQQERLLHASRMADIGLLAAGVAHEINTPLASIALRAESLLRSAEDPQLKAVDAFKNFPRYLKTIDEEIFRCKKIISALLEFSRARKPEIRDVDLNLLSEKAADLVSHQMKLRQVALGLRLDPRLPTIAADDGQLRQALIALLMNALDACRAQGTVTIETARESPDAVSLTVSDDGAGIPADILDKIFSPFFTTKPLGQGTGLGLAICHGVVTAHGGEIRVESVVGSGTRFSLVLPISSKDAAERRRIESRPPPGPEGTAIKR